MDEIPTSEAQDLKPEENQVVSPKHKSSKRPLLVLLVVLLIAGVSFGVWYWQQRKIDDLNQQLIASKNTQQAPAAPADPVEVHLVGPIESSFTVALPDAWVFGVCPDTEIIFLAPSADKLGKCNSESFGTVSISKVSGDVREPETAFADASVYGSVSYEVVTVNGVPGVKVGYTLLDNGILGYPPVNTKTVRYTLFKDGNSYVMGYQQQPGDTDYRAVFEDIATSFATP